MSEATVTPNESARRLGVTGLLFRNWLRAQKAAGHALLAGHGYRTRYRFTPADAEQLGREFTEHLLRHGPASERTSARTRKHKHKHRETSPASHPANGG